MRFALITTCIAFSLVSCRTPQSDSEPKAGVLKNNNGFQLMFISDDGEVLCAAPCTKDPSKEEENKRTSICEEGGIGISTKQFGKDDPIREILAHSAIAFSFSALNDDVGVSPIENALENLERYGIETEKCNPQEFFKRASKSLNKPVVEDRSAKDLDAKVVQIACTAFYEGSIFRRAFVSSTQDDAMSACKHYAESPKYVQNCKFKGCFDFIEKVEANSYQKFTPGQESYAYRKPDGTLVNYFNQTVTTTPLRTGGCFGRGTMVATSTGDMAIESLRPGDSVLTYDPESSKMISVNIERIHLRIVDSTLKLRLSNGREILTTEEHPFYAPVMNEWVLAGELEVNQTLLYVDKEGSKDQLKIVAIEREENDTEVFNLSVASPHTYIVEGIVVHNK